MKTTIKLTKIADQLHAPGQWANLVDVYEGDNGMTYVASVYEDDYDNREDEVLIAIVEPAYPFYLESNVYTLLGSTDKDKALANAGFEVVE